ncbi:hypothetical protein T492DRAFT_610029 [Pavlovales sp. CCMP2436]|nr:hypothetical protein T492DRAFT_610029 [Pavlovales sp. CCMP2436]
MRRRSRAPRADRPHAATQPLRCISTPLYLFSDRLSRVGAHHPLHAAQRAPMTHSPLVFAPGSRPWRTCFRSSLLTAACPAACARWLKRGAGRLVEPPAEGDSPARPQHHVVCVRINLAWQLMRAS